MRALAQYAMLGRRQAIIVVLLSGLLPLFNLISIAVVGLVSLRRSTQDAVQIALWALIPAILMLVVNGDPSGVIMVPLVSMLALLLKRTSNWQTVFIVATVAGLTAQLMLPVFTTYVASLEEVTARLVVTLNTQGSGSPYTEEEMLNFFTSFFGASICLMTLLCLMLARWWQATLVNPGGFQQEFHQLRLDPIVAAVFLATLLAGITGLLPLPGLTNTAGIAPALTGLGLAHGAVNLRRLPGQWLIPVYVAALFAVQIVIVMALADSVLNFRERLQKAEDPKD